MKTARVLFALLLVALGNAGAWPESPFSSGSGTGAGGGGSGSVSLNDVIAGASAEKIYFGGPGGTLAQTSTFTLTSGGLFGVGIASPDVRFHFKTSDQNEIFKVETTAGNAYMRVDAAAGANQVGTRYYVGGTEAFETSYTPVSPSRLFYQFSGTEIMAIDATGLGIGVTDALDKLHVAGNIRMDQAGTSSVAFYESGVSKASLRWDNVSRTLGLTATPVSANANILLQWSDGGSLYLNDGGTAGFGTSSPQNRLDVEGALVVGSSYAGTNTGPTDGLLVEGNTGIGTTTPASKLHVSSGVVTIDGTASGLRIGSLTNCDTIDTDADGDLACGTDGGGGAGDMILAATQTVTAAKTFNAPTVFNSSVAFTNTGTTNGISSQQIGNTPVTAGAFGTGRAGRYFDNTQNSGIGDYLYTNMGAGAAGLGTLSRIECANSAFAQPCQMIVQKGTAGSAPTGRWDGPSPHLELVEDDQTSPVGKWEPFQAQGGFLWLNSRNTADNSFENMIKYAGKNLGSLGSYMALMSTITFRMNDADDSAWAGFRAPDTVTTSYIWQMPPADAPGVVTSNGAGVLSMTANVMTNPATATLNMNGFGLINVASITMTPAAIVQSSTFTTFTVITSTSGGTANSTTTLTADASGANVVTGLSFDANGTGNVLKKYEYLQLPRADFIYTNSTPTINTSSGTYLFGRNTFSNSVSSQTNCAGYSMTVPEDIDTSVDLQVSRFKFVLGGSDTGTHRYVMAYYQAADSAVPTATLGGGTSPINLDFAGDASGASGDIETVSATTLTGWAASWVAGRHLIIEACRDGDASQDASTVNSTLDTVVLRYATIQ